MCTWAFSIPNAEKFNSYFFDLNKTPQIPFSLLVSLTKKGKTKRKNNQQPALGGGRPSGPPTTPRRASPHALSPWPFLARPALAVATLVRNGSGEAGELPWSTVLHVHPLSTCSILYKTSAEALLACPSFSPPPDRRRRPSPLPRSPQFPL